VVTVEELRAAALVLLADVPEGEPLDRCTAALIELGLCASVVTLDEPGMALHAGRALDAGATPEQVHEVLVLVSGLGVHTLMVGSRCVADLLGAREAVPVTPPDDRRQALWAEHVGDSPYWAAFEEQVPGFLDALLRLSPEAFAAFFPYCAVPWTTAALPVLAKELIAMASDATPAHRFGPGFRLHLTGAVRAGAGRAAVLGALDLAAAAPPHGGIR
jgi:alkylhydroperoxidase/carboxymuconolactone decarboxylase family protein YurZ